MFCHSINKCNTDEETEVKEIQTVNADYSDQWIKPKINR